MEAGKQEGRNTVSWGRRKAGRQGSREAGSKEAEWMGGRDAGSQYELNYLLLSLIKFPLTVPLCLTSNGPVPDSKTTSSV